MTGETGEQGRKACCLPDNYQQMVLRDKGRAKVRALLRDKGFPYFLGDCLDGLCGLAVGHSLATVVGPGPETRGGRGDGTLCIVWHAEQELKKILRKFRGQP